MTLTKNTDQLRQEVAAHVAADTIAQGVYWSVTGQYGCFIGCLAKNHDPGINEDTYGLPVMLQRIAENIFESLSPDEAKAFFSALPGAVACDGKDLSRVSWQFLATELRSLPTQSAEIQAVIDPVIAGMDLLASGQEWPDDAARAARAAARAARVAPATARAARAAARAAAEVAADAAWAAAEVAWAAAEVAADAAWVTAWVAADAAWVAAWVAADAAWVAAWVAADVAADAAEVAADAARSAARLRQRDLLLRLIAEAPVVENTNG